MESPRPGDEEKLKKEEGEKEREVGMNNRHDHCLYYIVLC
jgi:hypothetical protein